MRLESFARRQSEVDSFGKELKSVTSIYKNLLEIEKHMDDVSSKLAPSLIDREL